MINNKDQILDAADLVEVIQQYGPVELKRQGDGKYLGLCPFHAEKTPSFHVNMKKTDRGTYKCFGCGVGGADAAQFLKQHKGMTFPEALIELAAKYNVTIDQDGEYDPMAAKALRDEKQELHNTLRAVHRLYLDNRGIEYDEQTEINDDTGETTVTATVEIAGKIYDKATIEKWDLSIAPKLLLSTSDIDKQIMHERLGIIHPSKYDNGAGYFDMFGGRLLFPVHIGADNIGPRIAGYSARSLEQNPKAKYVNSRESKIYRKSEILYGFAINQKAIDKADTAILVEGQTDVIMLDQEGCSLAIAASGKELTLYQAKLIKRAASKIIIMLDGIKLEGDDLCKYNALDTDKEKEAYLQRYQAPEYTSAMKNVDVIIKAGLQPMVYMLPPNTDPADLAEQLEDQVLDDILMRAEDGLTWKIARMTADGTVSSTNKALQEATRIIAGIPEVSLRNSYMLALKKCGIDRALLKAEVKRTLDEKASTHVEKEIELSKSQQQQFDKFGIYKAGKIYKDYNHRPISNFIIDPLFHIKSKDKAERVFLLQNEYGSQEYLIIEQEKLNSLQAFRTIVERLGNFVFFGKDENFIKFRMLNYVDVPAAYPIHTLGTHKKGFFAMANGVIEQDGSFLPIDEHGIVRITRKDKAGNEKELHYFLPEHSHLNEELPSSESSDSTLLQSFIYIDDERVPKTFSEWAAQFAELVDHRGILPLAFFIASMYRGFIYSRYDFFPILNLFGPAGSGKTFVGRCLASLYGKPLKSVHAVTATNAAFHRASAQVYDIIRFYEEYSEKVPEKFQEAFKSFYDGFGRQLATMDGSNDTRSVPVTSSICVIGQILPTQDPALLERMCTEYFVKIDKSEKQKAKAMEFEMRGKKGGYSRYLSELQALRGHFEEHFQTEVDKMSNFFQTVLTGTRRPGTRVMHNYSILGASYNILSKVMKLPYDPQAVIDKLLERIENQSTVVAGAQELSDWWSLLLSMIDLAYAAYGDRKLKFSRSHFCIKEMDSITVRDQKDRSKTNTISFANSNGKAEKRKVLLFKMNNTYNAYREMASKTKVQRVLQRGSLEFYLRTSPAFIGEVKSVRLLASDNPTNAFAFDCALIPDGADLEYSTYVDNRNESDSPEPAADPYAHPVGDADMFTTKL